MKLIPIYASPDNPRQNILLITDQEKTLRLPLELWRNYLWFASTGRTWTPRLHFAEKYSLFMMRHPLIQVESEIWMGDSNSKKLATLFWYTVDGHKITIPEAN